MLVRVPQPMPVLPLFQVKGTSAGFAIVSRGHDGGLIASVQLNVCFMGPGYCRHPAGQWDSGLSL